MKNRIIGTISTLFFILITLFVAYKVTTDPEFFEFGVMRIWFGYVLLFLGLQGIYIRNAHMTTIKTTCLLGEEYYEPGYWKSSNMQMAYFIPLLQDLFISNYSNQLINMAMDDYHEDGYLIPTPYKIAYIFNKIKLRVLFSIVILVGIFVLPKVTNDYDLYRGLTYEQLIMITIGLGMSLYNIVTSLVNKVSYDIIDEYLEVPNSKIWGITLQVVNVFALFVLLLLLLSFITGVFNIYPTKFQFLFNFELIGVYILISPALLGLQTAILKNQYGKFNLYLNYVLR